MIIFAHNISAVDGDQGGSEVANEWHVQNHIAHLTALCKIFCEMAIFAKGFIEIWVR